MASVPVGWLGALLAALCAAADGALLSLDPDEGIPSALAGLHQRRERVHRALAFARVLGQLAAGIAVAETPSVMAETLLKHWGKL